MGIVLGRWRGIRDIRAELGDVEVVQNMKAWARMALE